MVSKKTLIIVLLAILTVFMFGCAKEETTIVLDEIPQEPEPVNTAPVVDAGLDQSIILPDTTTLNAQITDDSPESDIEISWEKISGPGDVIFSNPELITTIASFSEPGKYVLKIIVTDGDLIGTDEVRVTATQMEKSNIATINGDFEDVAANLQHFSDYDNDVGVGYTFARNNIGPVSGEGDVKIKITAAERDATERPAFTNDLTESVKAGNKYKVGLTIKVLRGEPKLIGVGFGGQKTTERITTEIEEGITRYEFDVRADTNEDKVYIYFDGTLINRFRLDDITVEEI